MRYFKINDLLIHLPAPGEVAAPPQAALCTPLTNTPVMIGTGCATGSMNTTPHCMGCTPHFSHVHGLSVGCGTIGATAADREAFKNALDELHGKLLADENNRTLGVDDIDKLSDDEKKHLAAAVAELNAKLTK